MAMIASTPEPPYFAVIFTALSQDSGTEYGKTAERMRELAEGQPGFLGVESAHGTDGLEITVSYWRDLDAVRQWKQNQEHRAAQGKGRSDWYSGYRVRVCKVEKEYGFDAKHLSK